MTDTQGTPAEGRAVATASPKPQMIVHDDSSFANLLDTGRFEHMWRVATVFSKSGMVPKHFQQKPEACFVAVQMAVRLEVDPFMFMQNTYLSPDGKPAMEGKLAIALINARGPFVAGVDFEFSGEGDDYGCTAFGVHKADGRRRELRVDVRLAKSEGWWSRNKKWASMTDQMLRYRAGAWLGKAICPEVLMGMQTADELEDAGHLKQAPDGVYEPQHDGAQRPTRAQYIDSSPTSTDEEAEAAHRAMDRQAAGQVDTDPADEGEASVTVTETVTLPPLPSEESNERSAWGKNVIAGIKGADAARLPMFEAAVAAVEGLPEVLRDMLAKAIKARGAELSKAG